MAPLLAESLDVRLELATGFDTDLLGSFTRDIDRQGNQLEAARRKAEKGMELLALEHGLASEGSFGPDPSGLFPWNVELVVLIDRVRGIEIVGRKHGLVLRPDRENDRRIRKGLADWATLHAAFDEARAESQSSTVFVESDLRAHMNPTRMLMIRDATTNLIERILSECPRCGTPGFWPTERIPGLPCRDCESPTAQVRAERWACVAAPHDEIRDLGIGRFADPRWCDHCNP